MGLAPISLGLISDRTVFYFRDEQPLAPRQILRARPFPSHQTHMPYTWSHMWGRHTAGSEVNLSSLWGTQHTAKPCRKHRPSAESHASFSVWKTSSVLIITCQHPLACSYTEYRQCKSAAKFKLAQVGQKTQTRGGEKKKSSNGILQY